MTNRLELLDLINRTLTDHFGFEKVSRRSDGVIMVAGTSEAFAIQAITIDAPDFANPLDFGEDLVAFIRLKGAESDGRSAPHVTLEGDEHTFYTSTNGDQWLLITDTGGRRFVRHVPNRSSGGDVELTDLQSFLDREPHSPQNRALEKHLS